MVAKYLPLPISVTVSRWQNVGHRLIKGELRMRDDYLSRYEYSAINMRWTRSVQPFLHSIYISVTNRQTDRHIDHATCDICRSRPHLCYAC